MTQLCQNPTSAKFRSMCFFSDKTGLDKLPRDIAQGLCLGPRISNLSLSLLLQFEYLVLELRGIFRYLDFFLNST